jgi:hypothetical protein
MHSSSGKHVLCKLRGNIRLSVSKCVSFQPLGLELGLILISYLFSSILITFFVKFPAYAERWHGCD